MRELEYKNKPMCWKPVNTANPDFILRYSMTSCYIHLEPGDGTRYELIVSHTMGEALVVQRVIGGDAMGTPAQLYSHSDINEIKQRLLESGGYANPWSLEFISWWLEELIARIF